jgi:hypothetical protein
LAELAGPSTSVSAIKLWWRAPPTAERGEAA